MSTSSIFIGEFLGTAILLLLGTGVVPIPGKGGSDWGYAWIPVVGPLLGGALAGLVDIAVFQEELHQ